MTILHKIEITLDHDPNDLSSHFSDQIIDFSKALKLFKRNASEFVDSGVTAYSKVTLIVQRERDEISSFREIVDGDFERAFDDKDILHLVKGNFTPTKIEQELIGMYK